VTHILLLALQAPANVLETMMLPVHCHSRNSQQGVVLIEALVAILIFSIGILAVAGLQASMIKNTSDAKYRSDASYIAQKRIGEIWSHPGDATYLGGPTSISDVLPSGTISVSQSGVIYTVTVEWTQPGQGLHKHTMVAHIDGNS
jgi:type IV pilus assembly protein PilV